MDIKIVENTVDTSKPGVYTVKYEVIDNQGAKATKTIFTYVIKNTIEDNTDSINENN